MDQTFSLNNMILIGSTARNSGKTTLATALVNAYQDRYPVIGLKISSIHEETGVTEDLAGGWQLIEETSRDGLKDTSKLLAAGANRVYWLKTDRANLEQRFLEFMGLVDSHCLIVCESNSLRQLVRPGIFIMMKNPAVEEIKPAALEVMAMADLLVEETVSAVLPQILQAIEARVIPNLGK